MFKIRAFEKVHSLYMKNFRSVPMYIVCQLLLSHHPARKGRRDHRRIFIKKMVVLQHPFTKALLETKVTTATGVLNGWKKGEKKLNGSTSVCHHSGNSCRKRRNKENARITIRCQSTNCEVFMTFLLIMAGSSSSARILFNLLILQKIKSKFLKHQEILGGKTILSIL